MQDLTNIITNIPQKGLVTDLSENLVGKEFWTHARNAQMSSHLGQIQFLQNEPSNKLCIDLPYTAIGFIQILNNRWVVFSTDNTHSEIGIFDETACTYTKVVNDSCLGFKTTNLIQGVSKENFDCTESIYWTDNLNPKRFLNLSDIPYQYTIDPDDICKTKVYSDKLDCDELLLEPKINVPNISPSLNFAGNLKNGTYQFAIAYANNSVRLSEFYTVTKPVRVWTREDLGQSISLEISNIDREFEQIEVAVIYSRDQAVIYKSLGFYSTSLSNILISSINRDEYVALAAEDIIIKRPRYPYAALVGANDQYVLWGNVTTRTELNYQPQAMRIRAKYQVLQVPADYYKKGGIEVGYERDEVYSFGIQWLYNTGEWSPTYTIPGRKAKKSETNFTSGPDVYETEVEESNCGVKEKVPYFEVYSTASAPRNVRNPIKCAESIIQEGTMGYWESTDLYPDNQELFGEDACTPIRHHKFPDNTLTHIYANEGKSINILGIKFENIEHPRKLDGTYDMDVVGYRIVRGDRTGNRSIIAKGIVSNVRHYKEPDGTTVMYPNYPYNDLRPDSFISSRQTEGKAGGEAKFSAVTGYYNDKFNFYGPHTLFTTASLGTEFKFYTEEIASVKGQFKPVYKHPGQKLLTQFDLYFALIIGALDGYYAQKGKKCVTMVGDQKLNLGQIQTGNTNPLTPPQQITVNAVKQEQACDDALAFTSTLTVNPKQLSGAERILRNLARVGVFAYFTLKTAQTVLDIIANAAPWQDYGKQYNSVGFFNSYKPVAKDNQRRYITHYQYVRDGLNTIENVKFNNYKREPSVFIDIHKEVEEPTNTDKTRNTISELKLCDKKDTIVTNKASMFYTAVKRKVRNQYGTVDSISYLDTGYLETSLTNISKSEKDLFYESGSVFGGDTFINRMAVRRSHHYFSLFLHDAPDGYVIDYRNYRNVGFPRYWIDTGKYNLANFISLRPRLNRTPANKHNLDCGKDSGINVTVVSDDRNFYLFNSGVINFFVESDFNVDFREYKNAESTFYSDENADVNYLFRSDKITRTEEFLYDRTYSKQIRENSIEPQQINYSSETAAGCQTNLKNRVIYSMPAFKEQRADNWRKYLPLNFYDFPLTDFGNITAIQSVDNQQFMFLFDKSSPYLSVGRDELKLDGSGKTITLGDGGLFSRDPRPVTYTEQHYGNSQSRWAFLTTQFGVYYPSQRQGRVFNYTGKLDDISRNGMHFWFKNYLPSKLLTQFPEFIHKDNPVIGVGMTSVFDNTSEIVYISKIDYSLKAKYIDDVTYNPETNVFKHGSKTISLTNEDYFDNASWTISFDPKTQSFISWHDWVPEWTLKSENHFFTVKKKAIWKHNDNYTSFCNFYGKDYPFEVEYLVNNGQTNEVLRSIEYIIDCGKYFNEGRDFHQVLDYNFDRLVVHNNEQTSGDLKLNLQSKKDLSSFFNYPKANPANDYVDILYNKEEQKTRINQFTDITKDRGEFTLKNFPLWITGANGYTKEVNQLALNYDKPVQHQKKFRGLWHKILLKKLVSGDKKMIFKIANSKETISQR